MMYSASPSAGLIPGVFGIEVSFLSLLRFLIASWSSLASGTRSDRAATAFFFCQRL
jgi:hypothetical protein